MKFKFIHKISVVQKKPRDALEGKHSNQKANDCNNNNNYIYYKLFSIIIIQVIYNTLP